MFGCTHFFFFFWETSAFAVCKVLMTPASEWAKKLFAEIQ